MLFLNHKQFWNKFKKQATQSWPTFIKTSPWCQHSKNKPWFEWDLQLVFGCDYTINQHTNILLWWYTYSTVNPLSHVLDNHYIVTLSTTLGSKHAHQSHYFRGSCILSMYQWSRSLCKVLQIFPPLDNLCKRENITWHIQGQQLNVHAHAIVCANTSWKLYINVYHLYTIYCVHYCIFTPSKALKTVYW